MSISWYLRRLAAMDAREIALRGADGARAQYWRHRYFVPGKEPRPSWTSRVFVSGLSRTRANDAPFEPRARLLKFADRLLAGEWPTFAVLRRDVMPDVDWHLDPRLGKSADAKTYSLSSGANRSSGAFDAKYVWELSRHHHTTVLAMAFWLTGEERYARAAAAQIESWMESNPFLNGIHWSSGIEIGMRLIAFSWARRLLEEWPQVRGRFEDNEAFRRCIFLHQWILANRKSHSSSANNHLIYEMAGLYVSACCMPWHANAAQWRTRALEVLEREFPRQIFESGYSRELASSYHGFVLEALVICLAEEQMSGQAPRTILWDCARRMSAALAQISDCDGHPPRQGDSDDASGLLIDAPDYDRWRDLAELSQAAADYEPNEPHSLRAWLFRPWVSRQLTETAPSKPVWTDSGLVILRSGREREIFCAFDAGPLGYLSIAAHGHADALSVEIRYDGQPVLIDPGTYSYQGPWREYFRSTAAHNTVELGGKSQSLSGGPFLWSSHARTRLLYADGLDDAADCARSAADHDGYLREGFRGYHKREIALDRSTATVTISDRLSAAQPVPCRFLFHLHPQVGCQLLGKTAHLVCAGGPIRMELPEALEWQAVQGSQHPVSGWYSPSYDVKVPTTSLIGRTMLEGAINLRTVVTFPG